MYDLHGTELCFVHKRLIKGAIGLITGGPGAAVGGFFSNGGGGGGGGGPLPPCPPGKTAARHRRHGHGAPCQPVMLQNIVGNGGNDLLNVDPLFLSPAEASVSVGQAVMGRYGAGMSPGNRVINRADCTQNGRIRGMVLGNDGVCYNRREISNKERMWPRGRRPLLTGGDMRAISTAARAAGRLERTTKRLQKIGLMKKPAPRRQIKSGPAEHHHHTS